MPCNFNPIDIKKTNQFIETGTYTGKTVEKFHELYETYHTIEIVESFYTDTKRRLSNLDNVKFYLGNSPVVLKYILDSIEEPVTFWLDAHYQGGIQSNDTRAPIRDELDIIKDHSIKDHFIMIDDVRLFGSYGTSVQEIENDIKSINDKYIIEYKPGINPTDVLVAYIK